MAKYFYKKTSSNVKKVMRLSKIHEKTNTITSTKINK